MVKTIPGSTTPEVNGNNGSVTFSFVIRLSFCNAVMAIRLTGQPIGGKVIPDRARPLVRHVIL